MAAAGAVRCRSLQCGGTYATSPNGTRTQSSLRHEKLSVMARLEVAVNSPLAFSRKYYEHTNAGVTELFNTGPDTVGIEFRGRLFVWHAFPSPSQPGPGREES